MLGRVFLLFANGDKKLFQFSPPSSGGGARGGGHRALTYHSYNAFAHAVEVPHHLFIRETKHEDPVVCEAGVTMLIISSRIRIVIMRLAIEFDGESQGWSVEIDYGISDRVLTTKFHAELLASNPLPQDEFWCGHARTQLGSDRLKLF